MHYPWHPWLMPLQMTPNMFMVTANDPHSRGRLFNRGERLRGQFVPKEENLTIGDSVGVVVATCLCSVTWA